MRMSWIFWVIEGLILFFSYVALADIDYKCLNDCANSGENSAVCMPKCSYKLQDKLFKSGERNLENLYNQFSSMTSSDLAEKHNYIEREKKHFEYNCMPECLKNNYQYKFCGEKCRDKNNISGF